MKVCIACAAFPAHAKGLCNRCYRRFLKHGYAVGPAPLRARHGANRYSKYGCRCGVCIAGAQESKRLYSQRHPDRVLVKRRERYERFRGKDETQERAARSGYMWTGPEMELVSRPDLSIRDVALMIGRTYYAVSSRRSMLRRDPKVRRIAGLEPMR